jgi:hypothetical protein
LEFSIGMGPVLFKRNKNGIQYSIRALPNGACAASSAKNQDMQDSRSFNLQKVWKRYRRRPGGTRYEPVVCVYCCHHHAAAFGDYMPASMKFLRIRPHMQRGCRRAT